MPTYKITDPDSGVSVKLTGDSPPTEAEIQEVFKSLPNTAKAEKPMQGETITEPKVSKPKNLSDLMKSGMESATNTIKNTLASIAMPGIAGYGSQMAVQKPEETAMAVSFGVAPVATLAGLAMREALKTDTGNKILNKATTGLIENINEQKDRVPTDLVSKVQGLIINPKNEGMVKEGVATLAEMATGGIAEATSKPILRFLQNTAGKTSAKVINGLLGARNAKSFAYGKNPGRGVAQEGIIATSFDDLTSKIDARISKLNDDLVNQLPKTKNIDVVDDIAKTFDDEIASLKKNERMNAGAIQRLEDAKLDLLEVSVETGLPKRNLSQLSAEDILMKKRDIGELTKFTGNPSDDASVNSVLKRVYGKFKGKLESINPKTRQLTERMADLITAKALSKNRQFLAQGAKITDWSNLLTMGIGTGLSSGNVLGGLAAVGIKKAIESPAGRTSLSKALANLSKVQQTKLSYVVPALNPLMNKITKGVKDEIPSNNMGFMETP